jgi:TetR/AcrR family transcriptional regulator
MPARASGPDGLTRIERERRAQIVAATVSLVAEEGHAAASLSRIARAAGVAKGTVVYHFATKDAVLHAAYEHALTALVTDVAAQVEAAPAREAPSVYVRAMIGHLTARPEHAHTIAQARLHEAHRTAGDGGRGLRDGQERWGPLATLLADARRATGRAAGADDLRTLAILAGGMIDAVVAEFLDDPGYDTAAAAERIVVMLLGSP